eukprot:PhM_4_TR8221/c0_g1_i2/m.5849
MSRKVQHEGAHAVVSALAHDDEESFAENAKLTEELASIGEHIVGTKLEAYDTLSSFEHISNVAQDNLAFSESMFQELLLALSSARAMTQDLKRTMREERKRRSDHLEDQITERRHTVRRLMEQLAELEAESIELDSQLALVNRNVEVLSPPPLGRRRDSVVNDDGSNEQQEGGGSRRRKKSLFEKMLDVDGGGADSNAVHTLAVCPTFFARFAGLSDDHSSVTTKVHVSDEDKKKMLVLGATPRSARHHDPSSGPTSARNHGLMKLSLAEFLDPTSSSSGEVGIDGGKTRLPSIHNTPQQQSLHTKTPSASNLKRVGSLHQPNHKSPSSPTVSFEMPPGRRVSEDTNNTPKARHRKAVIIT